VELAADLQKRVTLVAYIHPKASFRSRTVDLAPDLALSKGRGTGELHTRKRTGTRRQAAPVSANPARDVGRFTRGPARSDSAAIAGTDP
jgi:hypothetical protein